MSRSLVVSSLACSLVLSLAAASIAQSASPEPSPVATPRPGWEAEPGLPWIAYGSREGTTWLVRTDGSQAHEVAPDFAGDLVLPDWSPDGTRLVMSSRNTGGREPLYVYDLRTGELTQLFRCTDNCLTDDDPAWSPDGTQVAFSRALGPFHDGAPDDCGLWIGDLATGITRQRTGNAGCLREYHPRWSPDGTQLVYHREDDTGEMPTSAIFVMDIATTLERQVTDWDSAAANPEWSADGDWILYDTHILDDAAPGNIWQVRADGTGANQVTHRTEGGAYQPRVAPDGYSILFIDVRPEASSISQLSLLSGTEAILADAGWHPTMQPGHRP